ncbi:cytochrome c biogenesis heme-transporting ATPase CcmA [Tatumella sp. TA1]|uniref:cytochrome c biogenesis heme-transporting ATPase CcmA n=1 Tax=Rosenbergiella collisarenosi TaxID=1544695 RepID=UPI0008F840BD|nr:cytochrome c biogenesis heme-transporting ATPase CcmA [Rosenbergiella collisarenosi]MBT0720476.1 cytochrome c biogenesis heme-transporting ATPase CcmA [Rosenbergiella collisarenosi]QGX91886.1 cytochrome c biogenesis heme-transporting ATPase CcmA [Tatumella sp. TA1]
MLQALNISCFRDERVLFKDLTFTLSAGEIMQIEGENGAGKTTLLRLVTGLSRPEEGLISWRDQSITEQRELWHQEMLYLAHQPGIKQVLTAYENLHFYHPKASREAIYRALEEVDLAGYEEIPVANFSAGQQRRVALARLWLSQATLWILDEPLTAIDKWGVSTLVKKFTDHLAQQGMIVLTTHQDLPSSMPSLRRLRLSEETV